MLTALLLAAAPCIDIAEFAPLLNASVYEITQVWPYGDPGNSFVWDFKDGTRMVASFRHDGCLESKFIIHPKLADEIVRMLGDGI